MSSKRGFLAALCLGLVMVGPAFSAGTKIEEEETGRKFDSEVKGSEKDRKLVCIGTSCREKYFIAVNVYAVAQWVDPVGAKKALAKWKGKTGEAVEDDQAFYDALCAGDFEKRLRLEFVRDVGVEKIKEAFKASLKLSFGGTIPKYGNDFIAVFKKELTEKSSYEFHFLPGKVLVAYEDGKKLGTWKDKGLAEAVWKIWFQKELAEDKLVVVKKGLVSRLAQAWK